jgi:hypothetical protein
VSRIAIGLLAIGIGLTAFGWWGLNTPAGRQRYDEMAGMIPMAAFWMGCASGLAAIIWMVASGWRRHS